jgi:hypothetical protein
VRAGSIDPSDRFNFAPRTGQALCVRRHCENPRGKLGPSTSPKLRPDRSRRCIEDVESVNEEPTVRRWSNEGCERQEVQLSMWCDQQGPLSAKISRIFDWPNEHAV